MNLQKSLQHVSDLMARFSEQVKSDNAMGLLDKNRLSEDVLVPVLAEVYGYTNLVNLNSRGENYPGIDLGDETARVAFQITSDAGSRKIKETLETFVKNEYHQQYGHLIVYIITEKQKFYSGTGWDDIVGGRFRFAKKDDIQDRFDLLRVIRHLPIEKVQKIEAVLEQHFGESQGKSLDKSILPKCSLPQPNAIQEYWIWLRNNVKPSVSAPHLLVLQKLGLPIRLGLPEKVREIHALEESRIIQQAADTTSWINARDDGSLAKDTNQKVTDLAHALRAHHRVLIVGNSGSGKTILLQRFARRMAKYLSSNRDSRQDTRVPGQTPVLIELWRFGPDQSLKDMIVRSVKRSQVQISRDELFVAIERGYVLFLLDGLDEVFSEHRRECLAQIINLLEDYPRCTMVLTSRPFPNPPNQFYRFDIMPLTDSDIVGAVRTEFGSGQVFKERLKSEHNPKEYVRFLRPEVRQLCRRPLTLGMILTLLKNEGELPKMLYEVYDRFLSYLLDWEVRRGFLSSTATVTAVLEGTAYVMAGQTRTSLTVTDWMKLAGQAVVRLRDSGIATGPSAEEMLRVLLSTGLLRDLGGEILFSHRSLLEFLAAQRILNGSIPPHKDSVAFNFGVARFLCNAMKDATALLEEHLRHCDNVEMLMPLLKEVNEANCSMGRFEPLYETIALGQEMGIVLTYSIRGPDEEKFIEHINKLVETCLDFAPKALSILKQAAYGVIVATPWYYSRLWFERIVDGLEAYGWPGATLHRKFAEIEVFENLDVFSDDGFDPTARERVDVFYAYLEAIDKDDFIQASKHLKQIENFIRSTKS
jgi:energy-coupling factor transporter ATP-binding protein EcfA2